MRDSMKKEETMKPVEFVGQNCVYAKDQKEYMPLPALKCQDGEVISCWVGGFMDRIRFLFNGCLYVSVQTFNNPLQPLFVTTKKKEVISA